MRHDILLIYPPCGQDNNMPEIPPLGLAYLASFIRNQTQGKYMVSIWDLNLNRVSQEQFKRRLQNLEEKPGIIGIGGIVTVFNSYLWMAKICKEVLPDTFLVAGGSLASTIPHLLFKHSPVDICVRGEGENTFLEIIKNLENGAVKSDMQNIAGLFLWNDKDSHLLETPIREQAHNLDIYGFPSYDLLEIERYAKNGIKNLKNCSKDLPPQIFALGNLHMPLITSRGCTAKCTFCYRQFPKIGVNSQEFIKKHVMFLNSQFGINVLTITDELFNISPTRMNEMISCFTELKEIIPNLYFRISAARTDVVTTDFLKKLKKAGCFQIIYGLESGSQKLLNSMKKRVTVEQNRRAVIAAKEAGIHCVPQFVIGLPGENRDTLRETFKFIKSIDFWSYLSIHKANAYPGSEIYEYAKDNDLIKDEFAYVSSLGGTNVFPLELAEIPVKKIESMLRKFVIKREVSLIFKRNNFLSSIFIMIRLIFKKISALSALRKAKRKDKDSFIIMFGKSKSECLNLILYSWIRKAKIYIVTEKTFNYLADFLKPVPFIRKYLKESINQCEVSLGDYKNIWYTVNNETIDFTIKFYDQEIKNKNKLIKYYSNLLNTNKFEAYVKKELSYQIFAFLMDLHLIRLSETGNKKIVVNRNPLNEFILKNIENKYNLKFQIFWISPIAIEIFYLYLYYSWIFGQFIRRGVVFNKTKKSYKLAKEAAWGFHNKTLRDDILIDDNKFKKNDFLIFEFDTKDKQRKQSFKEAKLRCFDTASVPKLKININKNIFDLLFFYFLLPFRSYFYLLFKQQKYFFHYIFLFHWQCFPVEVAMNLFNIKCFISVKDQGEPALTIILNKHGSKNIIFHWSDLTVYNAYHYAFIAHDIYFLWGDIHYDYHADKLFVNKRVNIGCIYKREFNKAEQIKEEIISKLAFPKKIDKIVTFFDESFNNYSFRTESSILRFLKTINEFCELNKNVQVLLKPKVANYEPYLKGRNFDNFRTIWANLIRCDNFRYLDPLKWSAEEIIAISDVCINMDMNTPATIALICGKDALYFDNSENTYHPFAKKFKNKIVFDDKNLLFQQIDNILNKKFNCREAISEKEIREYDAFCDDNALDRLRDSLYELTNSRL